MIRRMLTGGAVRASDMRAQFIEIEAYEQAGGTTLDKLCQGGDGGWLQGVVLADRLVPWPPPALRRSDPTHSRTMRNRRKRAMRVSSR